MDRIRTKWYEYCENCSYRVKVRKVGIEYELSCENCGKVVILAELTTNRPE